MDSIKHQQYANSGSDFNPQSKFAYFDMKQMPNRIESRRSAYNGSGPDSRHLRSWQMAEALGGNPGNAAMKNHLDVGVHQRTLMQSNPYESIKPAEKQPSRQDVRIKFKNHEVKTTISKRASDVLKMRDGNTATNNDSFNILK